MQQKSICYVITQGELGGAQRYVFDLATNLSKGEWRPTVIIGEHGGELKAKLENAGIKVLVAENLVRNIHPLKDLLVISELAGLLKKLQPDIIHLNSSKAGVVGSFAAHLAGIKNVIFTAHGFAFLEPQSWFIKQIYFWTEKLATKFRKKIITVSEFDRQAAIKSKLCAPEKLIAMHNGIAFHPHLTSPIKGEESSLISLPLVGRAREGGKIVLGTIARDYPTKDLNTLRAAFAILKKEFSDLQLRIVEGMGAAAQLSSFDIYVCSSVKEGLPYTILEAAAAGLPIVSTRVGGIPEILEDGKSGLLVLAKNPGALAGAVKKLLDNPELAKTLGANARERVKNFSLEKMLNKTEAVYREICFS
ncbi:MAG: glycosyltransferase family 4 protein [Candidatus Doudnabacteria bacterium]|nr:glycosyltransferase family 4 protein [Candidatus Doudnabacteria bacterium]